MTGSRAVGVEHDYWGRMRTYVCEMYPPLAHLLFAILLFVDLDWLVRRTEFSTAPTRYWLSGAGICSVFVIGLLTRLMDELKDEAIDRRMFPHRPLPSGRVRRSDIERSIIVLVALYAGLNLGAGEARWGAAAVLVCLLLSNRHFFMRERLERSVTLTLLTHGPIAFIALCSFAALALEESGRPWGLIDVHAPVLPASMFWTMLEGYEVARKIRAPSEETPYDTYSKVWGPGTAVLVAGALQTWTLGAGLYMSWRLALPLLFPSALLAAYGVLLFGYCRFLLTLTPKCSRLDGYSQSYAMSILVALCAVQVLRP